jgi:hypothetical protein
MMGLIPFSLSVQEVLQMESQDALSRHWQATISRTRRQYRVVLGFILVLFSFGASLCALSVHSKLVRCDRALARQRADDQFELRELRRQFTKAQKAAVQQGDAQGNAFRQDSLPLGSKAENNDEPTDGAYLSAKWRLMKNQAQDMQDFFEQNVDTKPLVVGSYLFTFRSPYGAIMTARRHGWWIAFLPAAVPCLVLLLTGGGFLVAGLLTSRAGPIARQSGCRRAEEKPRSTGEPLSASPPR